MREAFINYIRSEKRYSAHTLKSYNTDLVQFQGYLSNHFETDDPEIANHQMVRSWLVTLLDNGLSPRSVNRKISTLKSFYKFLEKEQKIAINPMSRVISPKTGSVLPEFIKESELEKLITEIPYEDSFEGLRNKCIILTFYLTGIRVSELVTMKTDDVDMSMKQIKILGKRNKQRFVPLPLLLEKTIKEYLCKRNESLTEAGIDNPFLFITSRGKQSYQKLVYRIINKHLAYVSTNSKKSPHTLRHSFATIMLNNGAELNSIKEILGHSNLSATQVYTHNSIEKLKTIYKLAHPRA